MDRNEFLNIMRSALKGQIPNDEVESNIKYYEEYFKDDSGSDKLNELGDPRLIARTIIESHKRKHGQYAGKSFNQDKYESYEEKGKFDNTSEAKKKRHFTISDIPWYRKVIVRIILILIVIIIFLIGSLALSLLIKIGPLLAILFVIYLIVMKQMR